MWQFIFFFVFVFAFEMYIRNLLAEIECFRYTLLALAHTPRQTVQGCKVRTLKCVCVKECRLCALTINYFNLFYSFSQWKMPDPK